MIEFFLKNKDVILYFISIVAFVMSTFHTIVYIVRKLAKIKFDVLNKEYSVSGVVLTFRFTNLSDLPISIHSIDIVSNSGITYSCQLLKEWISERYYPKFPETDIPRTERVYSTEFPANLESYQSSLCFVKFEIPEQTRDKLTNENVKIIIHTNRRKFSKSLNLKDVVLKQTLTL